MRNGNKNLSNSTLSSSSGSYRTYEEWKRGYSKIDGKIVHSSYRTYEEWKRKKLSGLQQFLEGSYRTYEEWKPVLSLAIGHQLLSFLPYL